LRKSFSDSRHHSDAPLARVPGAKAGIRPPASSLPPIFVAQDQRIAALFLKSPKLDRALSRDDKPPYNSGGDAL
jgi:hypothetical protein